MADWANFAATSVLGVIAAVIAAVEILRARSERLQADRQGLVELHHELTSIESLQARALVRSATGDDAPERVALKAQFDRGAERVVFLNRASVSKRRLINELYRADDKTREQLSGAVHQELVMVGLLVDPDRLSTAWLRIEEVEQIIDDIASKNAGKKERPAPRASRSADKSTYRWGAEDHQLTKHQLIQRIARTLALNEGLQDRQSLQSRLSQELELATGRRPADEDRMLWPVGGAGVDSAHAKVAREPIELTDGSFVVRNHLGLPTASYATRTQMPLIEHFAAKPDYPISRV